MGAGSPQGQVTLSGRQHAAVSECVWGGRGEPVRGSRLEDPRRWAGGRAGAGAWAPTAGRSVWGLRKPAVKAGPWRSHANRAGGSQSPVPRFQQHAFQKQPAVAAHAGLVQPQGQVGQGEVAVRGVRQLPDDGALQEELLPVHGQELVGHLVWNARVSLQWQELRRHPLPGKGCRSDTLLAAHQNQQRRRD